ncbi:MAG TPA: gas vesicle protein GvpG [Solirubrobacteraceae bacterium]
MGLISGLLTLPLAPVKGAAWVADQVAQEADRRLYDEEVILHELAELEMAAEEGQVSDQERTLEEERLLERMNVARARRRAEREEW